MIPITVSPVSGAPTYIARFVQIQFPVESVVESLQDKASDDMTS